MSEPDSMPEEQLPLITSPFDKFTERARKVMTLAQAEAIQRRHQAVGTEHLLLALLREGDGIAAKVLTDQGITLDKLESAFAPLFAAMPVSDEPQDRLGMTPRAKIVMVLAVKEAKALKHRYIGTEHLLLGILAEEQGPAATVLQSLGVTANLARIQVTQLVATHGRPESGIKNNVVTCRLDDRILDALDALVAAGIRSSRSDAVAWLLAAGIDAHRELFDRVNATVAEIRQLRAEAQSIARQVTNEG